MALARRSGQCPMAVSMLIVITGRVPSVRGVSWLRRLRTACEQTPCISSPPRPTQVTAQEADLQENRQASLCDEFGDAQSSK